MKRFLSMLVVLSMVLSMSSFSFTAFSAVEAEYSATGNFAWDTRTLGKIMTATQENGEYTFVIDTAKWTEIWNNAFVKSPYVYCYFDENGNVVDKATGDANPESYTMHELGNYEILRRPVLRLDFGSLADFEGAETEPLVVSYDYWFDNEFTDFANRVAGDDTFMSNIYFTDSRNVQLNGLNITASSQYQYIKGRTSGSDTSYIRVDGSPAANQWNTMQLVLKPDLSGVLGTVVNGVYTEATNTLSGATSINKMVFNIGRAVTNKDADGKYLPSTYKFRNIKLQRGLSNIVVSANIQDGATNVNPGNIKLSFSEKISDAETILSAVSITDCFGEALQAEQYTVVTDETLTGATVKITDYIPGQMYSVKVDNLSGVLGEVMSEEFSVSFVTAGKSITEPVNIAEGKAWAKGTGGANASTAMSTYGTVTNYGNGDVKVEIDNKSFFEYLDGCSLTSGDSNYNLYATHRSPKIILPLGETADNGKPIAVSFKMKSNLTDVAMHKVPEITLFGSENNEVFNTNTGRFGGEADSHLVYKPASAGETWADDGQWHEYSFVIDPTLDENGKGKITRVNFDGAIAADNPGYTTYRNSKFTEDAPIVAGSLMLTIKLNNSGTKTPLTSIEKTVVEIEDVKVYRLDALEAEASDTVLHIDDTTFGLNFSTPVYKDVLEQSIKVYKNDVVQEDITATVEMANENKAATVMLNGLNSPEYTVSLDGLTDIYGVGIAEDAALIDVTYHKTNGVCNVASHTLKTVGEDVLVSLLVENMMSADKNVKVIAAAYGADNVMLDVDIKDVSVATGKTAAPDVLTLSGVAGKYSEIRVYLWDGLTTLKPMGGVYTVK